MAKKAKKLVPVYKHKYDAPDPTPMVSKVAFKRPLSAHERVLRAIKQSDAIRRMNEAPGDDTFDGPDYETMSPHQLMYDEQGNPVLDPVSGEQLTAGEHVMLQHERLESQREIRAYREQQQRLKANASKKPVKKPKKVEEEPEAEGEDSDD